MAEEKMCEACRWYTCDKESGVFFCLCIDSPIAAEEVKPDESCRAWEGK